LPAGNLTSGQIAVSLLLSRVKMGIRPPPGMKQSIVVDENNDFLAILTLPST
jgi:hypothetical protein